MPASGDVHLEMAEFRLLRELFNEHCGILFGPEARPILERRLRDRIAALGDGQIIAQGTIAEMLESDHPWLRSYFHGKRGRAVVPQGGRHAQA